MQKSVQERKNFHMLINIALTAFLILVATIGMRSLTYTGDHQLGAVTDGLPKLESVMVCAIGQCDMI